MPFGKYGEKALGQASEHEFEPKLISTIFKLEVVAVRLMS